MHSPVFEQFRSEQLREKSIPSKRCRSINSIPHLKRKCPLKSSENEKRRQMLKNQKSSYFIAYRTLRNVAWFFSWTWSIEIPCGHRDRRKRRHFSVRCYIHFNPHVQFASLLTAYVCSETSLISVKKQFDTKYSPLCRNRNSGEAKYDQNFAWSKFATRWIFLEANIYSRRKQISP